MQLWGMEAVTRMTARQSDTLASAAAGDEIAFQRIIDTHHEDMRRVCQAICGDHAIADEAVNRKTGARGLRSIIEASMRDVMFEIPSQDDVRRVVITREAVTDGAAPEVIHGDPDVDVKEA